MKRLPIVSETLRHTKRWGTELWRDQFGTEGASGNVRDLSGKKDRDYVARFSCARIPFFSWELLKGEEHVGEWKANATV